MFKKTWETPQGSYYNLFSDMLKQPHLLVAGATGSGKSVVINGIITTALKDSPAAVQFIFIDPKRVELVEYKPMPHTLKYASEPGDMVQALQCAMDTTERRYKAMQSRHEKNYSGGAVYCHQLCYYHNDVKNACDNFREQTYPPCPGNNSQ